MKGSFVFVSEKNFHEFYVWGKGFCFDYPETVLLRTPNIISHIFGFIIVPEGSQDIQYAGPFPCS